MTYYLSLGSNLGEREQTINRALACLEELAGVITSRSEFFYSAPWGYNSPNPFCNLCCCVETNLQPLQMLQATQAVERRLGRSHKTADGHYEDRTIDIDLIRAFDGNGQEIRWETETLTLPHPLWQQREFVRVPLQEIITKQHKTIEHMRTRMVAGNWKMNKNLQEGVALATELKEAVKDPKCAVVIGTPFIHLATVAELLKGSPIKVAAENCADHEKGAYTGEVSAEMVKSTGAEYVILGHSERRQYYAESYEMLAEKVRLALANGLKVIFCIGEVKEEREAGKQNEVVKAQLEGSVFGLSAEEWKNIVLAYEPVWAIGTGLTATPEQAQEIHAYIRSLVADKFGKEAAEDTTILYGGSCNEKNAAELFACPDIDGGLIGGAALVADKFLAIIAAR